MHFFKVSPSLSSGTLLGLLTLCFYGVLTLLPGSSTMIYSWPWVFIWQVALLLPMVWLLWQLWFQPIRQFTLGNGIDWLALVWLLGLVVSTVGSEFYAHSLWQSWGALGYLAALYALTGYLKTPSQAQKLLIVQGYLGLAFILLSLSLWLTQTYFPELSRLSALQAYGIQQGFDFSFSSLRNWHPLGHQNYVAGYLLLIIPLLFGLGIWQRGWQRWAWFTGGSLGLLTLYTTSSRGGWLGLVILGIAAYGLLLWRGTLSRRWKLGLGLGSAALVLLLALGNNRLRELLAALLTGKVGSGELAYRMITNVTGWHMGINHPLSGTGLGSVPLVFQKYRPIWAGREAELIDQLHSTPANLWGEFGLWGFLLLAGVVLLGLVNGYRWMSQPSILPAPLVWSIWGGLLAYGVIGLTDYQLHNVCIAGCLVVYGAVLAAECRWAFISAGQVDGKTIIPQWQRGLVLAGLGLLIAMVIWLIPVQRAWAKSNQGFIALKDGHFGQFVDKLTQAQQLAPWDPYYSYQLAWNIGNLSFQLPDATQQAAARQDAITWFQTALNTSPYQEFGHSNLGWLQTDTDLAAAQQSFVKAAQLIPAKQGVFFGLGFSTLLNQQTDQAIEALTLELLRHPLLLTSPTWQLGLFPTVYEPVLNNLNQKLDTLLDQHPDDPEIVSMAHRLRGSLRWWQGDTGGAREDWQASETTLGLLLLDVAAGQPVDLEPYPETPGTLAIAAWLNPGNRRELLEQAWVALPTDLPQLDAILPPPEIIDQLETSMNQSATLDEWLQQNAPSWRPRNERLGFGVLSRHIDGPTPVDYLPRIENIPVAQYFQELLDVPKFFPNWDIALQPGRDKLFDNILSNS
jgi:tetratricopeptide (TPR) repeat protein